MSLHRLEPLLHACARGNGDLQSAVDTVKAQIQSDVLGSSDDLFTIAATQWSDQKDANVSTFRFLVLVVACEWERQLLQFLLQHHPSDAVDDMDALYLVCAPILHSNAAGTVLPVLDVLLATAAAFTLAHSHEPQFGTDPSTFTHSKLLVQAPRCPSCSSPLFPLADAVITDYTENQLFSDPDDWTRFLELSSDLDARKLDSKRGRALSVATTQVVDQQQRLLAFTCLLSDDADEVRDGMVYVAIQKMRDVATQVLQGASLYVTTNACGTCGDRLNADLAVMPLLPADDKDAAEMDLILDDAALERYLLRQAQQVTTAADLTAKELDGDVSDSSTYTSEMSCFQKLLKIVKTETSLSTQSLGGVVQKAKEELLLTANLDILGVQVSFLLAGQMRSKRHISELDDNVNKGLTRQVLKEFNSLTGGDEDGDRSIRALLTLSGFCPSLVLREIVSRAMTAPQQVETYVQILNLCSLLADWKVEERDSPLLICALQSTLKDLISAEDSFEAQRPHLLSLMCALAGAQEKSLTAVLSFQTLVQEVLLPILSSFVCREENKPAAMGEAPIEQPSTLQVANFFSFLRAFVSCATADINRRTLDSESAKTVLALLVDLSQSHCWSLTVEKVKLQNTLLLTIKNLLESTSPLDHAVVSDGLKKNVNGYSGSLDAPLLMLIAHFDPEVQHSGEGAILPHHFQELDDQISAGKRALNIEQASRTSRLLLWKLLWSAASPSDTSPTGQSQNHSLLSDERVWELLNRLHDVSVVSSATVTSGKALIQKELAYVMLVCRTSLFASMIKRVLPRLVQILDQPAPPAALQLKLPEQIGLRLDTNDIYPAVPASLECDLPVSHLVMKLVSRSWSLLLVSSEHLRDSESELVLQMGHHFLVSCDRAISDSKSSLAGLLVCFQWVCYLLCVVSCVEVRTKELDTCDSMTRQLNVTLLRLLHLLNQIHPPSEADASFSKHFVASWMAQLPQETFEQARNFVSSAARNAV